MEMFSRIYLTRLLCVSLLCFGCSRFPSEADFKDWLRAVYERETGLQSEEIFICSWERISEEVLRAAPDVDGLKVQAVIYTFPHANDMPGKNFTDEAIVHYVYCNYYKISDEWYLHASSWGGGFWKQEPAVWGYLVKECKVKAERFRSAGVRDSLERYGRNYEKHP